MKVLGILTIVGLMVFALGSICFAEEAQGTAPPPHATAATKLGNGLGNMLTGWMEIPRQISDVSQAENGFVGITYGTLKGSVFAVGRTAAGAIDTVTFPIPAYDRPIVEPNYQL